MCNVSLPYCLGYWYGIKDGLHMTPEDCTKEIVVLNMIIAEQAAKIRALKDQILYIETVCSEEGSYKP